MHEEKEKKENWKRIEALPETTDFLQLEQKQEKLYRGIKWREWKNQILQLWMKLKLRQIICYMFM